MECGIRIEPTLNHLHGRSPQDRLRQFHIAKLSEAVDQVRRRENKQLNARGDDRLSGTRYDWLRHPGKMASDAAARASAVKARMMAFVEFA